MNVPRIGSRSSAAPVGIEEVNEEEVFDDENQHEDEDEARSLSNEAFEVRVQYCSALGNSIYEQYY